MSYRAPLLAGFILLVPAVVLGAGLVPCDGPECQACDIVKLAQNVINWLVGFSVLVAVGMFAFAGVLMVTAGGNPTQITRARGIFTTVAIGFVIVLAAWLIVDTVMKLLVDQNSRLGTWNAITCVEQSLRPGTGQQPDGVGVGDRAPGTYSHEEALLALDDGIEVTSTAGPGGVNAVCPASGAGCTTLAGIRQDTISQANAIQRACPTCDVKIVGATEGGHAGGSMSHGSGYKIDVEDTASVNSFFTSSLIPAGTRTGDPRYLDSCGNEYVRESTHWDITVSKGSCSI